MLRDGLYSSLLGGSIGNYGDFADGKSSVDLEDWFLTK